MLIKATAIVKFSGIYKWDIINPLKDCLKNGKPIKNEQLGYECNVFDLFIHDATKAFVNAEFKLKIGVILTVTEEQFIEANKNIKEHPKSIIAIFFIIIILKKNILRTVKTVGLFLFFLGS